MANRSTARTRAVEAERAADQVVRPRPRVADLNHDAGAPAGGAREMQAMLEARFAAEFAPPAVEGQWSRRRSLVFAVTASALLWGAIGMGAWMLLKI